MKLGVPHVVILGAGASRAAFPEGDKNGIKLPLMNDFVKTVGLEDILREKNISYKDQNFEDLYEALSLNYEGAPFLEEINFKIYDYFDQLRLPDNLTIYDKLIFSLRGKEKLSEEILKNIIQPIHFLKEDINEAKCLYNATILNNKLTREQHTKLHSNFQDILNGLKVLANRLKNHGYRDIWLSKVAHGYSHTQNFSFQYFYEGGEYICEHSDVAPFYESKIINTFDPEEAVNNKIKEIEIVLYLQKKKSIKSKKDKLIYELNSFLDEINKSILKINQKFRIDF